MLLGPGAYIKQPKVGPFAAIMQPYNSNQHVALLSKETDDLATTNYQIGT